MTVYRPVCVGPGRSHRLLGFSCKGSYKINNATTHEEHEEQDDWLFHSKSNDDEQSKLMIYKSMAIEPCSVSEQY